MSDTLYESEILKSLEALDDILSKSQIETGKKWPADQPKGKSGWADGEKEDDPEGTEPNGTDMKLSKGDDPEAAGIIRNEEEDDNDDTAMDKGHGYGSSVSKGVEVSDFLNELTKSIAVYCNDLEDFVTKALFQVHEENGAMSKAIAENLMSLNDIIEKSQGNITEYAEGPSRGPKSMLDMSKSVSGSQDPELSKSVVLDALMKGVEAGTISPLEIIKVEQFGVQAINQNVVKSLLA